jgi:hypothetical protein
MTQQESHTLADALTALLTCETRGLLSHLDQAKPYLSADTLRPWLDIQAMSRRTPGRAAELSRMLESLGQSDHPTTFPLSVAYSHYLSVPGLVPALLTDTKHQIAAYERALALSTSDPALVAGLRDLLDQHRAFVERLLLIRS